VVHGRVTPHIPEQAVGVALSDRTNAGTLLPPHCSPITLSRCTAPRQRNEPHEHPIPPVNPNTNTLNPDLLQKMHAYWRAANYLSVGQIYLYDNPLLKRPLKLSDVKAAGGRTLGTTPGQNFIYVHLNRVIKKYDLDMFYIAGPGHGGPAIVGNVYLEGTWSEVYPNVTQDEAGLKKLFTQFSFPGGISSHVAPTTPGSIHEGGELGYSLSHAFGAAFDNPGLIVACVVGDGESEPGLWRPPGSPTSSSTQSPMGPFCQSCT